MPRSKSCVRRALSEQPGAAAAAAEEEEEESLFKAEGEEADGRPLALREAGAEEWMAREVAMASHYLLQDWFVTHQSLPPSLEALGLGAEVAGLGGWKWEVQAAGDVPGGYRVSVGLSDGRRVCVRGDALLWVE